MTLVQHTLTVTQRRTGAYLDQGDKVVLRERLHALDHLGDGRLGVEVTLHCRVADLRVTMRFSG